MPRKSSRLIWLRYAIVAAFCLGFGTLLAWPAFEAIWTASADDDFASRQNRLDQIQWIQTVLIAGFLYTWFFFFGATVGSFLNVVIWRMPRGETVVTRPSRCPWCSTNLKWNDNIPVLGWLMLGGRCRTCRLPISPRYPIVEAIMGGIFLLLLQFELLTGGGNLPGVVAVHLNYSRAMLELQFGLIGLYLFHCFLFCLLLCWSLIAWDRQRMPLTLALLGFGVGFVGPLIWPALLPVRSGFESIGNFDDPERFSVFLTLLIGMAEGALLGLAMRCFVPSTDADGSSGRWGVPTMMFAVGLFFGWQAAATIAAGALLLAIIISPLLKARGRHDMAGGLELSILTASLIHLLSWQFWNPFFPPHPLATWGILLGIILFLGLVLRKITWRPSVDLQRFRRTSEVPGNESPNLQLLASPGTIPENNR
ncbi:prepilin peptidase [Bremerella cremea]|uniref:Prepilin peptidase n=1 Tax=Bremerella cremea TaxID=1031537 RepID=A0A368KRB9_9BACT|nr:A24 family peptidase [Bremerella cremea]RCS49428.1 prepilin peptidase [Bremerella cremea]